MTSVPSVRAIPRSDRARPPRIRGALVAAATAGALAVGGLTAPISTAAPADWGFQSPTSPPTAGVVEGWLTDLSAGRTLDRLPDQTWRTGAGPAGSTAVVDPTRRLQSFDGYGSAMTETSASLLTDLDPSTRAATMAALFSPSRGIGLSAGRVPFGASDFAVDGSYSYDDVPAGQTDPDLSAFGLGRDLDTVLPRLQEARALNPDLMLTGSPWSPPGWMKTSDSMVGGTLRPDREEVFARYLERTADAYAEAGVPLQYLTLQNEPLHGPADYPGMVMPPDQARRVAAQLLPRLGARDPRLLAYDHNWDERGYPESMLADPALGALAGIGWHCYGGDITAQTLSHNAFPDAQSHLTECSGGQWQGEDAFAQTMSSVIDGPRNFSQSVVLWNLALDPRGGPTNGGCQTCRGVVTVDGSTVRPELEYWALAHGSAFVRPGAVRIASSTEQSAGVRQVAFANPDRSQVLIAHNDSDRDRSLTVQVGTRHVTVDLPADAALTLRWADTGARRATFADQVALDLGSGTTHTPGGRRTMLVDSETLAASTRVHDGHRWWSWSLPAGQTLQPVLPGRSLDRAGWRASATASAAGEGPERMLDGDPSTRWSSGTGQSPDQSVTVDLGGRRSFDQIVLDARGSDGDAVRGYRVRIDDGRGWRTVATGPGTGARTEILLPATTASRVEVSATIGTGSWWSIHEFELRTRAGRGSAASTTAGLPRVDPVAARSWPAAALRADLGRLGDGTTVLGVLNASTQRQRLLVPMVGQWTTVTLPARSGFTLARDR